MVKAVYLHIPFCEHICHYCDFNKVFLKGQPVDEYLTAMEREIEITLERYPTDVLDSIFVGGGTPTSLNEKQLARLCEIIRRNLPIHSGTEFTFEANPGDLSEEKFRILFDAGVNRLSFGVQTFNNDLLKKIGRTHRAEDVFKSVELAKKTGFKNISLDLIYSLPGQTLEDFKETLKTSFTLDVVHYSGYSLIIEPKTVFYNLMKKGQLPLPGEDIEASMYGTLMEEMEKHGYRQYEISNFSKPGYESNHNITYWNNDEYYGIGAGAHSYLAGVRRSNYGPLKKYMDHINRGVLPTMDENILTKEERMEEEMFLGLRKKEGILVSHFQEKFAISPVELFQNELIDLQEKGLVLHDNDRIVLTKKGLFLGNEVFQSFIGVNA
ncbi:radical SAM family heme chaperone HemW [Bacillus dakarensis]|uniref:radical SAM family heme chaperone HemW n=1 Tax=Robertmurraya dakarensis TaxID=1926278 RepID=UPI000980FAC3|nr:radical SAM family heme chaperone HemW [Bacillus dakarensis]